MHGILIVHVATFGGPMLPDGHMAASNNPVSGTEVTARDSAGHRTIASTNPQGDASLTLVPGRYTVRSSCGTASATVTMGHVARATIHCDVP